MTPTRATTHRKPAVLRALAALCATVLTLVACHRGERSTASSTPANFTGAVHIGKGVACSYLGSVGPPSYSVYDIGKRDVPTIDPADLRVLRRLMQYVHPSTLRFAMLNDQFSVFDATNGPCSASPYAVLNAPSCNAIYVPYDANGQIGAAPGCNMRPRPWIPHDAGNPHGLSWTRYPNSH